MAVVHSSGLPSPPMTVSDPSLVCEPSHLTLRYLIVTFGLVLYGWTGWLPKWVVRHAERIKMWERSQGPPG